MWVFCKSGFFSAVEHREDAALVMVRARFRGDLERFLKTHKIKAKVACTPGADYKYRITIKKDEWSKAVSSEAEAIDYDNFKSSVHDGSGRDTAYMRCWAALRTAQ